LSLRKRASVRDRSARLRRDRFAATIDREETMNDHRSAFTDPRFVIFSPKNILWGCEKNLDTILRIDKSCRNEALHGAMSSVVMSG